VDFSVHARQMAFLNIGGALTSQDLSIDTKFSPSKSHDAVPLSLYPGAGILSANTCHVLSSSSGHNYSCLAVILLLSLLILTKIFPSLLFFLCTSFLQ